MLDSYCGPCWSGRWHRTPGVTDAAILPASATHYEPSGCGLSGTFSVTVLSKYNLSEHVCFETQVEREFGDSGQFRVLAHCPNLSLTGSF
jgi:hypothetical protein